VNQNLVLQPKMILFYFMTKNVEYKRSVRNQKEYDGNSRNCLYGNDADLFMLGIICHEPNLTTLRYEAKH